MWCQRTRYEPTACRPSKHCWTSNVFGQFDKKLRRTHSHSESRRLRPWYIQLLDIFWGRVGTWLLSYELNQPCMPPSCAWTGTSTEENMYQADKQSLIGLIHGETEMLADPMNVCHTFIFARSRKQYKKSVCGKKKNLVKWLWRER